MQRQIRNPSTCNTPFIFEAKGGETLSKPSQRSTSTHSSSRKVKPLHMKALMLQHYPVRYCSESSPPVVKRPRQNLDVPSSEELTKSRVPERIISSLLKPEVIKLGEYTCSLISPVHLKEKSNAAVGVKASPKSHTVEGNVKSVGLENKKRKLEENRPPFVSTAEIVKKFEKTRSFNMSPRRLRKPIKKSSDPHYKPTLPVTPRLITKSRTCRSSCTCALKEKNGKDSQNLCVKHKKLPKSDCESDLGAVKDTLQMANKEKDQPKKSGKSPIFPTERGKVTVPKPFSFHDKDVRRFALRDERLEREREFAGKIPHFNAQPLKPTQPQPFHLPGEQQRQIMAEKFQKEVDEQLKREEEARVFNAQPCDVLYKLPFEPAKSDKPPTVPIEIHLETEKRSVEREAYDNHVKEVAEKLEALKLQKEQQRQEELRLEEIEIRKGLVHKANPITIYPPIYIEPCPNSPTVPKSPKFQIEKTPSKKPN